jgi:hypothetical protein
MQEHKEKQEGKNFGAAAQKPSESTPEGVVETVKEKIHDLGLGMSELASKTKDTAQEWASSAADLAGQAKDKAVEFASTAGHKVGDFGQEVTDLIRRYPLPALLIGFGLGFAVATASYRSASPRS